jgi:Domain of unknown function (DUF4296)
MGTRGIGVSCLTGKPGRRVIMGCRVVIGCLVILLTGVGCADKQSVPSGILPLNKMQSVMWDMVQADQYAALAVAKDSVANGSAAKGPTAKDSTAKSSTRKDSTAKDSAAHITRIDVKAETLKLYEEVFRLHDVSREEFSKSYQYYLAHPELNQMLFDSLISLGNRLRTESYSRPNYNRTPAVITPRAPAGAPSPLPGGMPLLHSTITTPPGQSRTFPHQPVILPGGPHPMVPGARLQIPGAHPLTPGGFPTKAQKAQKDSARKHS